MKTTDDILPALRDILESLISVGIFVGASAAYACITAPEGRSMNVMLSPGMSAAASLLESADELRLQASRKIRQAELMELAARKELAK